MSLQTARSAMSFLKRAVLGASPPPPPFSERSGFHSDNGSQWYDPVLLSAETVGRLATGESTLRKVSEQLGRLDPDDYLQFVKSLEKS